MIFGLLGFTTQQNVEIRTWILTLFLSLRPAIASRHANSLMSSLTNYCAKSGPIIGNTHDEPRFFRQVFVLGHLRSLGGDPGPPAKAPLGDGE